MESRQVPILAPSATLLRVQTIVPTIGMLASQVGEVFLLPPVLLRQRRAIRTLSIGALHANVGQLRIRPRLTEESRVVVEITKRLQWSRLFMIPQFGQLM